MSTSRSVPPSHLCPLPPRKKQANKNTGGMSPSRSTKNTRCVFIGAWQERRSMASVFRLQWIPIGALSHPGAKRTKPPFAPRRRSMQKRKKIDAFNGFFSSLDSLGLSRNRKLCVARRIVLRTTAAHLYAWEGRGGGPSSIICTAARNRRRGNRKGGSWKEKRGEAIMHAAKKMWW